MSKKINVNPSQYKVAGRERQGEDVVHHEEKQDFQKAKEGENLIPGAARNQDSNGKKVKK